MRQRVEIHVRDDLFGVHWPCEIEELADRGIDVADVLGDAVLEGSLPPVFGDKGQLQQAVLNIVINGAEAMSRYPPEQRKLILRMQRKDHCIWVTVRDFGPGINKENLERIFQPFFTTKGTGLGMGLAVCNSIIKDHHGRIWAENNPDGGATFFIELPIDKSGKERVTSDH